MFHEKIFCVKIFCRDSLTLLCVVFVVFVVGNIFRELTKIKLTKHYNKYLEHVIL